MLLNITSITSGWRIKLKLEKQENGRKEKDYIDKGKERKKKLLVLYFFWKWKQPIFMGYITILLFK